MPLGSMRSAFWSKFAQSRASDQERQSLVLTTKPHPFFGANSFTLLSGTMPSFGKAARIVSAT